jgi:hypothetical protein
VGSIIYPVEDVKEVGTGLGEIASAEIGIATTVVGISEVRV